MEWDTTWNCAAGKAADLDADVAYDPWEDDDVQDGDYTILDPADDDRLLLDMAAPEFDPDFKFPNISLVVDRGPWLLDKILTLLCKTKWGFGLCYRLGLARFGIDFFDAPYEEHDCSACGSDCPEFDKCFYNPGENQIEYPF